MKGKYADLLIYQLWHYSTLLSGQRTHDLVILSREYLNVISLPKSSELGQKPSAEAISLRLRRYQKEFLFLCDVIKRVISKTIGMPLGSVLCFVFVKKFCSNIVVYMFHVMFNRISEFFGIISESYIHSDFKLESIF